MTRQTKRGCGYDPQPLDFLGGAEGSRTPDLLNAIQALSQLSYNPTNAVGVRPITQALKYCQQFFLSVPDWEA